MREQWTTHTQRVPRAVCGAPQTVRRTKRLSLRGLCGNTKLGGEFCSYQTSNSKETPHMHSSSVLVTRTLSSTLKSALQKWLQLGALHLQTFLQQVCSLRLLELPVIATHQTSHEAIQLATDPGPNRWPL